MTIRSCAIVATLALTTSTAVVAHAEPPASSGVHVFLETDPATFALGGYAAHVRVALDAAPGWAFGVGVYGMDLPSFVPALHPDNEGEDWQLRINGAYGLFADYHFAGTPEGLFVGMQAALHRDNVSRGDAAVVTEVGTLLLMPRLGYLWHPIDDVGLYLMPWVGVGGSLELYRSNEEASDYTSLPLLVFGTLHVGWRL